ncbi:unnamed protein product [Urochloa humidicola]
MAHAAWPPQSSPRRRNPRHMPHLRPTTVTRSSPIPCSTSLALPSSNSGSHPPGIRAPPIACASAPTWVRARALRRRKRKLLRALSPPHVAVGGLLPLLKVFRGSKAHRHYFP